ncbi:MAG: UxaA family hydrolase [Rhodothermaceae bacterium]|nr:UxaA family hydrolase [Rhodothermaceae bacterium]
MIIPFEEVGRLPFSTDNVAIATTDLDAGSTISMTAESGEASIITLSHTVLEGHRFAVQSIREGEELLSWGMPFGRATRAIKPGEYVCNDGVLDALSGRSLDIQLPGTANFSDEITSFQFDKDQFAPNTQVERQPVDQYFMGYDRGVQRGVGTRNHVLLIGVSSRVAGFVRHVEKQYESISASHPNIDGVVGIVHTEGDDAGINNKELVLRTLAGFVVHPNTGAVILIDDGSESISIEDVKTYMAAHKYPDSQVLVETLSVRGKFVEPANKCRQILDEWLPLVNSAVRTRQPISELKIALQCGGSDAFSGISGNPLAGWVARELIRQGGSANLAETDELVGAEPYILKKVKSQDVAQRFLDTIDHFVKRAERHGSSAAGNPSGGNKFRGLYNIYLKSLGAAMKKHPDVCLDDVIEYGQRMTQPGYYFMDSPGNDLESIAGQVASGCNLIYFVTGNGSITNFPFVPTVKIVTTTRRFELLKEDMDVNAGAYLDGLSMDELGAETLSMTLNIASGAQSAGERAGHSQVQLWRNWKQPEDGSSLVGNKETLHESLLPGHPIQLKQGKVGVPVTVKGYTTPRGPAFEQLGLILPTSLCAGQVARMAVDKLNEMDVLQLFGVDRFVTLVHTEGCGASSGSSEDIFMRTMHGHLIHPNIKSALLLEHGCEKTHNDYFRNYFHRENLHSDTFGWASIQLGGGIQKTFDHIESWFKRHASGSSRATHEFEAGAIKAGLLIDDSIPSDWLEEIAVWIAGLITEGGSVVVPALEGRQNKILQILGTNNAPATLAYSQSFIQNGLHVMDTPSLNWQETITGLGATGINVMLYIGNDMSRAGHPFIPLLQVTDGTASGDHSATGNTALPETLSHLISETLSGTYQPIRYTFNNIDFQITRGLYGISL